MDKSGKKLLAEKRVLSLVELINFKFGGNSAKMAKELGISRSLVHSWISFDKTLGDRAAENIERKLQIPSQALQRGLIGFFEGWISSGEPGTINQPSVGFAHPIVDVLDGMLIIRHPAIGPNSRRIRQIIDGVELWLKGQNVPHDNATVSSESSIHGEISG